MERWLGTVKILYKLLLTATFVFNKDGMLQGPVGLVCFITCSFIVYRRLTTALMFKPSVYYATTFYQTLQMWLFLSISLHTLFKTPISIATLSLIVSIGIILGIIAISYLIGKKYDYFVTAHPERYESHFDFEIYFFHLYELIESPLPEDHITFLGVIYSHM